MTDITQKFPLELLAEILGHVPASDALRFKQVNRVFRDTVLASPLIKHKIDLFAAGLEYNAAAGISLADSRKAFLQYCSGLDSLRPIEERTVSALPGSEEASGGVYAIKRYSVRLFALGSVSRGIPYKEWKIPLPSVRTAEYDLCPDADVVALVEHHDATNIGIHLKTLSDGEPHPAARFPMIRYSRRYVTLENTFISITSSRLVVLPDNRFTSLSVLDWKSAQVLFEFEWTSSCLAEFIDDRRLLVVRGSTFYKQLSLFLVDTGKFVGRAQAHIVLCLPPRFFNWNEGRTSHPLQNPWLLSIRILLSELSRCAPNTLKSASLSG